MGRFDALTSMDKKPESPQAGLPAYPKASLPESPLEGKPVSGFAGKPESPQARLMSNGKVEKYTTRLEPSVIKQVKQYALAHDMKDYEVVQQAVKEYLTKR